VPAIVGYYFTVHRAIGYDQWAIGFYYVLAVVFALAATVNPSIGGFSFSEKILFPGIPGIVKTLLITYWLMIPILIVSSILKLGIIGLAATLALLVEYSVWKKIDWEAYRILSLLIYPATLLILTVI
jgi:predicted ferric reductase